MAERTAAEHLLEVGLAHHAPGVGGAGHLKAYPLADHRDVAVVRVAGIVDVKVLAAANGLTYAGMQLAGRGIVENQFQFGVALHPHGAVGCPDAILEVFAKREGAILETRTGQGHASLDRRVEYGACHEQVVVARLMEDVAIFALDQVADHVVWHPCAEDCQQFASAQHRLQKE